MKDAQRRNGRTRTIISAFKQQPLNPLANRWKPDTSKPGEAPLELAVRRSKSIHTSRASRNFDNDKQNRRSRTTSVFYTDRSQDVTTPFTTEKELTPLHVNDKTPEELLLLLNKVS